MLNVYNTPREKELAYLLSDLINKDGYEFAKVIGSIDFEDPKFVKWLLNYD